MNSLGLSEKTLGTILGCLTELLCIARMKAISSVGGLGRRLAMRARIFLDAEAYSHNDDNHKEEYHLPNGPERAVAIPIISIVVVRRIAMPTFSLTFQLYHLAWGGKKRSCN